MAEELTRMWAPEVRSIYQLTEQEVNHVIHDVEIEAKGVHTFYTVDSHEVIDFCFPVNLDPIKTPDANQVADDQAALYEIFYAREPQPVLIPDYEQELRRHLTYLTMRTDDVYRLIEEIDKLVGNQPLDDIRAMSRDQILEKMEVQFNNLLAVVMGIHSTGVERFREVIETRLERIANVKSSFVREAANAYAASSLVEEIYIELARDIETGSWSEPEIYRKLRAAEIDARAVDWLIHMNSYLRREGRCDYRILYLSSAHKTRRIFSIPSVRAIVDRQLNFETPLYRSRAQILAAIVSTEPGSGFSATTENLKLIREIVKEIKLAKVQRTTKCDRCLLQGGQPEECGFLNVCKAISRLEQRRESMQNMGLLSQIQKYEGLLGSKPKNARHEDYVDYFRKLMETENLGDLALARMKTALSLAHTESQIVPVSNGVGSGMAKPRPTSPSHFLPIQPRMIDERHQCIVDMIFEYPELEVRDRSAARNLLKQALDQFSELDRQLQRTDRYHELVRCLIYMTERETARDVRRGDENALQYARKMRLVHPELRSEFLYVMVWTARRLRRYQESHNAAREAIEYFPEDARFYHGRSVNTMYWLEDEKQAPFCPMKREHALADAWRALDLYSREAADRTLVKAIQLNNIAWTHASSPQELPQFDLRAAREALTRLTELIPRSSWLPFYPGFFHTEAYIECEEYKRDRGRGGERSLLRAKLENADEALRQAMTVEGGEEYDTLKSWIKGELDRLGRKSAKVK
ncbi:MAG TPA: hypothetical protein VMF91_02350 [Bryobacteraceae bacterium]|nr:hypothetical protein [Bryobacteraceae bacterium]